MTPATAAVEEPQKRTPRAITSDLVDQNSPAFRIIRKAGGLAQFCDDFDFKRSTVHSWLTKRNGRGSSGLIPSRTRFSPELGRTVSYQAYIIAKGATLSPAIEYTPDDFAEDTD